MTPTRLLKHHHTTLEKIMKKTLHYTAIALCWLGFALLLYMALVVIG